MSSEYGVTLSLRRHFPEYLTQLGLASFGTAVAYVPALVLLAPSIGIVKSYLFLAVVGWSIHVAQQRISMSRRGDSEAMRAVGGALHSWQYGVLGLGVGFYHISVLSLSTLAGVLVGYRIGYPVFGLVIALVYPVADITAARRDWRLSPSSLFSGLFLYVLYHRDLLEEFPSSEVYVERTLPEYFFALPVTGQALRGVGMVISGVVVGGAVAAAVGAAVAVYAVPEQVLVFLAATGLALFWTAAGGREDREFEPDRDSDDRPVRAATRAARLIQQFQAVSVELRAEPRRPRGSRFTGLLVLCTSLFAFVNISFLSNIVIANPTVGIPPTVSPLSAVGTMVVAAGGPFVAAAVVSVVLYRRYRDE